MPGVLSRLIPTIAATYGLQAVFALIFVPLQSEKFYDCCGAIGWASSAALSLYYPALKAKYLNGVPGPLPPLSSFAPRQLLITAALSLWTIRLGSFLTQRAIKHGGDSRFDTIKTKPATFSFYWFAQATWIALVGLPVYLANAIPAAAHPPLGPRDYLSVGLFAGSFLFEVIADNQKTAWRKAKDNKEHDEQFITSGLWGISRHPNYLGEIGLWTGVYALSTTALQTSAYARGTVALAAASPLFTYYLLRYVSGVPPLERSGKKKFGGSPKWEHYTKTVPVFWPWVSTK